MIKKLENAGDFLSAEQILEFGEMIEKRESDARVARPMPAPEAMHGAADEFGGEDFYEK